MKKNYIKCLIEFSKNNINVLSEENSMIHVSGHPGREESEKNVPIGLSLK